MDTAEPTLQTPSGLPTSAKRIKRIILQELEPRRARRPKFHLCNPGLISPLVNGTMAEVLSSEKVRFPFSCKTNLTVHWCVVCPLEGAAAIVVRQFSKALFIPASGPPQVASRSASLLPRSKCPARVTVYSETLLPESGETHG